jgi:hypothetical protein
VQKRKERALVKLRLNNGYLNFAYKK